MGQGGLTFPCISLVFDRCAEDEDGCILFAFECGDDLRLAGMEVNRCAYVKIGRSDGFFVFLLNGVGNLFFQRCVEGEFGGDDVSVLLAAFGFELHLSFARNEFGLGIFTVGCRGLFVFAHDDPAGLAVGDGQFGTADDVGKFFVGQQ